MITPAFLVIDKPKGVTSHDIVAAVRAVTGIKKVGHTGTLDPFATGVLPLALGGATRMIQFLDERIKVYDALVQLGSRTDTGDPTGEVTDTAPVPPLDEARVREVLESFVGDRMQEPPAYSAVKVKGKPLYAYARAGEAVRAKARPVTIHDMELTELGEDQVRVTMTCSRGTYARVLADEIGVALGTFGHLAELCRVQSGPFHLSEAMNAEELASIVAREPGHAWKDVLMGRGRREERVPWSPRDEVRAVLGGRTVTPIQALSHLPLVDVDRQRAKQTRSGGALPAPPSSVSMGGRYLVVCGPDVVAIAEASSLGPKTVKVLSRT